MNTKHFIPTLVLTQNFLPAKGGTITWMLNTYGRYQSGEVVVVTEECEQGAKVDKTLSFPVERISMNFADWDPTNVRALRGYVHAVINVCKISRQYGIKQIHVARVLPEGLVALFVRWVTRVPYLLYAHGEEIQTHLTSKKFSWLMPKIYNGAAAVIANSTNTKHILENIGTHAHNIHIINPGVSGELFNNSNTSGEAIRERHKLRQDPVLLTVGRLNCRKGQDMVIKALPKILDEFPTVKYLIVGIGGDGAYLQNLVYEYGVVDHVVFAGEVPDDELSGYYAAGDIFVMPNRQIGEDIEGFGIVFLEASAMGKPVIGGTSGGTEDAIVEGVTGFRVDGTQIEAICDAVRTLLSDPTRAKALGDNGRQRVLTEFTWEQIFQKTRSVVDRCG
ncbi:glycosyltransferase family 4 protein [Candidatus Nitronereus thalassa]|uniref:Glycosyltransferase family 4 protein n=1 Tax=Candidatus Nitronereus thalassa TaxID=3020898 RepID=A0ABU3K6E7_9BACT|nr:glycosyltransferase family 4 protein [Candidatus Nitronereus thalassa]MDT7041982.1 glycosyltransferase family 4 protein [Candidatus Nitronereus thalassa]